MNDRAEPSSESSLLGRKTITVGHLVFNYTFNKYQLCKMKNKENP